MILTNEMIVNLFIVVLVAEDVQFQDSIQNRFFDGVVQGVGRRRIAFSGGGKHFGRPKKAFYWFGFCFCDVRFCCCRTSNLRRPSTLPAPAVSKIWIFINPESHSIWFLKVFLITTKGCLVEVFCEKLVFFLIFTIKTRKAVRKWLQTYYYIELF